jgi:hypothetical protein
MDVNVRSAECALERFSKLVRPGMFVPRMFSLLGFFIYFRVKLEGAKCHQDKKEAMARDRLCLQWYLLVVAREDQTDLE